MNPKAIMLVAGDPSGDVIAGQLVNSLRVADLDPPSPQPGAAQPLAAWLRPRFFGAGGPAMRGAGVELAFDLTKDAVIGPEDALRKLLVLKRRFGALLRLALEREPDLIVLVDFGAFNWRLARAIRRAIRARERLFFNWRPRIVQYVSPQVWASRPGRADKMARDLDLLLCLFPFEKPWYGRRVPALRVEFVGHPMLDRPWPPRAEPAEPPMIVLLPGSRANELKRHLPVMLGAARIIAQKQPVQFRMVLDSQALAARARTFPLAGPPAVEVQVGGLSQALSAATVAITKTGTISLECACCGLPAVAIYKTSWSTYALGRWLATVDYLAMPNLLAGQALYPELIQHRATSSAISEAALELLANPQRRKEIQAKLSVVVASLGGPGATARATQAIAQLMRSSAHGKEKLR